jgi:hypothetical protein
MAGGEILVDLSDKVRRGLPALARPAGGSRRTLGLRPRGAAPVTVSDRLDAVRARLDGVEERFGRSGDAG